MDKKLDLTDAEWSVMEQLWAAPGSTGRALTAALEQKTNRILAAQAADDMLNISGITASFVLFQDENQVIISARSIGDANVQMILEPLGGGGNAAVAGAQLKDTTVKDALNRLVESIDQFYEG